jgi:hypothetical protein
MNRVTTSDSPTGFQRGGGGPRPGAQVAGPERVLGRVSMANQDRDDSSPRDGAPRPLWLQLGIGLAMGLVALAVLYVLLQQLQ